MENIELILSEAIKNGKWLDISYENKNNEITYYWIAIKDINLKTKVLSVEMFNDQKSLNSLNASIDFERIYNV